MMTVRSAIVLAIVYLLAVACEDPSTMSLSSRDSNLLVVEGVITNEKANHLIRLSLPYKTQNENPAPASGATVQLTEDNTIVYTLTETPAGSGKYYTPEVRASVGKNYVLSILYQGNEFSAQDSPVPVEPLEELKYKKVNDLYEVIFASSGEDASYINHAISWKDTDACTTETGCAGRIIFYDLKTIDVNEIYKPEKDNFYFPVNATIIRTKYSVSVRYKAFLRGVLSETEWRGGIFDVQRADVPTNLSKGAVGFFAVSTVVSDTTIILGN